MKAVVLMFLCFVAICHARRVEKKNILMDIGMSILKSKFQSMAGSVKDIFKGGFSLKKLAVLLNKIDEKLGESFKSNSCGDELVITVIKNLIPSKHKVIANKVIYGICKVAFATRKFIPGIVELLNSLSH